MSNTSDLVLQISGFLFSLYGGFVQDLLSLTIGLMIIFISITLRLNSQEEDIRILNAQINTQARLQEIKDEIKQIKDEIHKK